MKLTFCTHERLQALLLAKSAAINNKSVSGFHVDYWQEYYVAPTGIPGLSVIQKQGEDRGDVKEILLIIW